MCQYTIFLLLTARTLCIRGRLFLSKKGSDATIKRLFKNWLLWHKH
jgi:hypothetical protein